MVDTTKVEVASRCKHCSRSIVWMAAFEDGWGGGAPASAGGGRRESSAVSAASSSLAVVVTPEYGTQALNSATRHRNSKAASCRDNLGTFSRLRFCGECKIGKEAVCLDASVPRQEAQQNEEESFGSCPQALFPIQCLLYKEF